MRVKDATGRGSTNEEITSPEIQREQYKHKQIRKTELYYTVQD